MKKILLGMMALTIAFSSMAQSDEKAEGQEFKRHGKHFDKDKFEKLNLKDEQKAQMEVIKEDFKKKMEELRGNTGLSEEERKSRRKEIMKEHKEKIQAVLTPEQRKEAEEMRKEHHEGKEGKHTGKGEGRFGKGDGKGFGDGDRFEKMSKDLNLSAEQSTRIKALNETLKTNIKGIRENNSLSDDQKKEQVKTLMESHRTNVQAILTREQRAQMEAKMKDRKGRKPSR